MIQICPPKDKIFEQRRIAGLCFKCGDKYSPRHQCKKQLLLLEGAEGTDEEEIAGNEEETKMREEEPSLCML